MFKQQGGAPVPADALAAALAPFGQSRMLPREAYVDPAVFAWEQQHIFSGWSCVGHASDLVGVGAQKAVGTGVNATLLVRAEDDVIRAFANTCRHRGHELLACNTVTKGRGIVCPYHSWSYRLDGRLRKAPTFGDVEGFEPGEFGLAELRLVNWHGWLFVDPSGQDVEFAHHVTGLDEVVGPYHPEELTIVARHSYELAANWKVIAENYQECYHCPRSIQNCLGQPAEQRRELDLKGSWMGGWMDRSSRGRDDVADGEDGGVAMPGSRQTAHRACTSRLSQPAREPAPRLRDDPPDRRWPRPYACRVCLGVPEDGRRPGFDPSYAVDFWDLTNRQDWAACESVQRGLTSPYSQPGPLAPDEDGVYHFVTRVAKAYSGGD